MTAFPLGAQKAEDAKQEKKRAEAAKKNSEIRVAKENLKKKLPELRQLAQNGKKLTEEDIQGRHESVDDLERRIENIPDGLNRSKFGKVRQSIIYKRVSSGKYFQQLLRSGSHGASTPRQSGEERDKFHRH